MPLPWPSIQQVGGDLSESRRREWTELLNQFGDKLNEALASLGLPAHVSPLFRPWNLVAVEDDEKGLFCFSPLSGGTSDVKWLDKGTERLTAGQLAQSVAAELGWPVAAVVVLPRSALSEATRQDAVVRAVEDHVKDVKRVLRRSALGDIRGFEYLDAYLETFLTDHPEPPKNVFIMMRFSDSDQHRAIHETIRSNLQARGFNAIRADDRDYTGDLWTNIELCMLGSGYGIAVFEDIDDRAFNPNVSLELGFMLARRKRCLILKEQRLPDLPTDVVGKLYKSFDMFDIERSVGSQVVRWIDVDLAL